MFLAETGGRMAVSPHPCNHFHPCSSGTVESTRVFMADTISASVSRPPSGSGDAFGTELEPCQARRPCAEPAGCLQYARNTRRGVLSKVPWGSIWFRRKRLMVRYVFEQGRLTSIPLNSCGRAVPRHCDCRKAACCSCRSCRSV